MSQDIRLVKTCDWFLFHSCTGESSTEGCEGRRGRDGGGVLQRELATRSTSPGGTSTATSQSESAALLTLLPLRTFKQGVSKQGVTTLVGVRQRSGEGVVRRNGCPKECFWRVRFFSAPLRFSDVLRANLEGAEKKRTVQKHPFGQPFLRTTPSPLLCSEFA